MKKLLILSMCALSVFALTACGSSSINLNDYVIERRDNLFTASDDLYTVTLSSGTREENYNLDGIKNDMVEFGVLTLSRNDNNPLANDNYHYIVTIGEETISGEMQKSQVDNSYSVDLERSFTDDAIINVEVKFTGYTFCKDLENVSNDFAVDLNTALKIANDHLANDIKNVLSDKNTNIEVVTKILKDYSIEEVKRYYWYIGAVSTNGETLGILIDANTGDIIAKKV